MIDLTYEERIQREAENLRTHWDSSPRWSGIERTHSAEDVIKLGSITIEHTLARLGAERLWWLMTTKDYVHALGALSGGQAVEMVKAGLNAIYVSGCAGGGGREPRRSHLPRSVALPREQRADPGPQDQQCAATRGPGRLVRGRRRHLLDGADPRRRRGRVRRRPEHVRAHEGDDRERRGGVHFEDQLASEKKCGHLGGKVLVPTSQFLKTLSAPDWPPTFSACRPCSSPAPTPSPQRCSPTTSTRSTAPSSSPGTGPTRGSSGSATASDGDRTGARVCTVRGRGLVRDLDTRSRRGASVRRGDPRPVPRQALAYNCSPSFNWRKQLDDVAIASFQRELGAMGYRFQFITLAGFHALNASMFELAHAYAEEGMSAYVRLQEREFELESLGYSATRHQAEVGTATSTASPRS